jgi:hypothetical protein
MGAFFVVSDMVLVVVEWGRDGGTYCVDTVRYMLITHGLFVDITGI